ncbi:hypothetical protein PG991_001424 [Apiospora marii]|uniref:Uncharacterized protein n=1 Tax=Apiospora marii TaxID=335849 RepID=A0ABR1SS08_9PEZI
MPENSPIRHRHILAMFFLVHGVLAVALIWGRLGADGTLDRLQEASNDRHYQLPQTTSPLPQAYTGLYSVDRTLRTVIILFWGAIDGLSPATTTAALYFAGQMFPIASSIFLDGLRVGNGAGMVKTALWYELIGLLAIGCVGPMWGYMHVRSSATFAPANTLEALQGASLLASPRKAILLLPALVVTFLGPLVVMGLPSVIYAQRAIIIWNLFPVILVPLVRGGQLLWDALSPTPLTADLALAKRQHQQAHLLAVRWLGTASLLIGFATHFAIGALSVSALLFPFMFAESYAHDLHPFRLFLPHFP